MATVFVYGDLLLGDSTGGWLAGVPQRPAWVRGRLWWSPRGQPGLVSDGSDARVSGALVDVDPGRCRVLDVLLSGLPRAPISAAVGLRPVRAESWYFADGRAARFAGYRRPRGTS